MRGTTGCRQRCAAGVARVAVCSVYALAVLSMAVPAPMLANALPAAVAGGTGGGAAPRAEIPGFAEDAAAMGLVPASSVVVENLGRTATGSQFLVATTSAAAEPFGDGVFFRRINSHQLQDANGVTRFVAESEMQVGHANGRVWIDFIDRFADDMDEAVGRYTGLAGVGIRKRVEFALTGFDLLVQELSERGPTLDDRAKQEVWADLVARGDVTHGELVQTVVIELADGSTRTMSAEDFQAANVFGELGVGAGSESCVIGCFGDVGITVSFLGAVCLVLGAAVCAAACAASAGVACIPCISGASLTCGLGAAAGSLGYCLAKCLFGVDPPTPTRTPTRTRTRTPTPDRAVVYTIDPPTSVDTGGEFTVGWTASGDHAATDWIAIFVPGAENRDYGNWGYLTAERSGAAQLVAPDDPGVYELRVLLENGYLEPSQPARAPLSVIIADPGDCNGDERITISELIIGISIALGRRDLADCTRFDGNGDGIVQVAELIRAIAAALR